MRQLLPRSGVFQRAMFQSSFRVISDQESVYFSKNDCLYFNQDDLHAEQGGIYGKDECELFYIAKLRMHNVLFRGTGMPANLSWFQ